MVGGRRETRRAREEAVALALLTVPAQVVLDVLTLVVGLAGLLLCTGGALHCLRRDRPLAGLGLLLAGPLVAVAAQVLGPAPVAAALALAVPLGLTVRPPHPEER
jgi:hypothetical protein